MKFVDSLARRMASDAGWQFVAAATGAATGLGLFALVRTGIAAASAPWERPPFLAAFAAVVLWQAAGRIAPAPTTLLTALFAAQAAVWAAVLTLIAPAELALAPALALGAIEWRAARAIADRSPSHRAAVAPDRLDESSREDDDGDAWLAPSTADVVEEIEEPWVQQQTRGMVEGGEFVRFQQRVLLEAGQRLAVFHVGFCPPLSGDPTLEVEQTEGPSAKIRVTDVRAAGARVEVRVADPADGESAVVIEGYCESLAARESAA